MVGGAKSLGALRGHRARPFASLNRDNSGKPATATARAGDRPRAPDFKSGARWRAPDCDSGCRGSRIPGAHGGRDCARGTSWRTDASARGTRHDDVLHRPIGRERRRERRGRRARSRGRAGAPRPRFSSCSPCAPTVIPARWVICTEGGRVERPTSRAMMRQGFTYLCCWVHTYILAYVIRAPYTAIHPARRTKPLKGTPCRRQSATSA